MARIYVKAGTLHQERLNQYKNVYDVYALLWARFNKYKKEKDKIFCIRTVECLVEEAGIRGKRTGLISEAALNTKIKVAKGEKISKMESISTEHPITYRSIAKYLLSQSKLPSYEYFYKCWLDNLVTVKTTFEENIKLKEYQKDFDIKTDCWKKDIYKKAKVKLTKDLHFKRSDVREALGIDA